MNLQQNSYSKSYKKLLITILLVLLFTTQSATDIFVPALPVMAHDFGVSSHQMNMAITYYVYAQAFLFLIVGQISDVLGRKRTIVIALFITIICTFLISESRSLENILILRIFQALGSAGVYIVSRLIIKEVYAKEELLHVTALFMLGLVLSPALAPVVGAFILKFLDWRWIFRISGMFLIIFWIICICLIRESNTNIQLHRMNFKLSNLLNSYYIVLKDWLFIRYVFIVGGTFASYYAFITMSSYMYVQEFHISEIYYSYLFTLIAFGYFMGNKMMSYLTKRQYSPYDIIKVGIVLGMLICIMSVISYFLSANIMLFMILITLGGWLTRLATAFINPPIQVGVLHSFPKHSSAAVGLLSSLQYIFAAVGSWSVGALDMLPSQSIIITTIAYTLISIAFFTLVKKKDFA